MMKNSLLRLFFLGLASGLSVVSACSSDSNIASCEGADCAELGGANGEDARDKAGGGETSASGGRGSTGGADPGGQGGEPQGTGGSPEACPSTTAFAVGALTPEAAVALKDNDTQGLLLDSTPRYFKVLAQSDASFERALFTWSSADAGEIQVEILAEDGVTVLREETAEVGKGPSEHAWWLAANPEGREFFVRVSAAATECGVRATLALTTDETVPTDCSTMPGVLHPTGSVVPKTQLPMGESRILTFCVDGPRTPREYFKLTRSGPFESIEFRMEGINVAVQNAPAELDYHIGSGSVSTSVSHAEEVLHYKTLPVSSDRWGIAAGGVGIVQLRITADLAAYQCPEDDNDLLPDDDHWGSKDTPLGSEFSGIACHTDPDYWRFPVEAGKTYVVETATADTIARYIYFPDHSSCGSDGSSPPTATVECTPEADGYLSVLLLASGRSSQGDLSATYTGQVSLKP